MKSQVGNHWAIIFAILLILAVVTGCTVVKHDEEGSNQDEGLTFYFQDGSFDSAAFVDNVWESRVLPVFREESLSAVEVLTALDDDIQVASEEYGRKAEVESPYTFRIFGRGRVIAANTDSAAATVELELEGYNGDRQVLLQIGPVIKKSAVRDSLEFISFGDFTNQLEYAGVSKDLNFRVRDEVVSVLNRENLLGSVLIFNGAFTLFPNEPILITPVILETGDGDG